MVNIQETVDGIRFWIVVKPRSKKNELVDVQDQALRIRVTAPPVEGAANEACRAFLARLLGTSKTNIIIRKGETASRKLIECKNITRRDLESLLPGQ